MRACLGKGGSYCPLLAASLDQAQPHPVEVRLTRTELPAQGKWVLVALNAFSLIQQQEVVRQRQQERWESLQRLSRMQQKRI
jgi:hypothetical protein